ncbi:hypothetical protein [Actinoplanes sp. NBRC 101535]|uniref:hypothetical protein n=1 Tax=Actinoplanes sp. NBRC 101535 TaxID=3032196 RepID=UPI0024A2E725|nr:hypothetical protein [Actinoplanes sp. NBRC 101535]GLY08257.1 hypothetical protein Acsp01_86360 [Actinoplanes sp. NBRC 101535]
MSPPAPAVAGEIIDLREASGSVTAAPKELTGRLIPIDVIRSGWNRSGSRYYPDTVLERDVPVQYPAGTQMYIDHPTASEDADLPERSLRTLAAVFEEDPYPVREADGRLVMRTTARVFAPWQPLIREAWETIGVSINGTGNGEYGTAEGRDGLIIEALTSGRSVDFVTVPGAGGRILALMESDRSGETAVREAESIGTRVESQIHLQFTQLADGMYGDGVLTRDERILLSSAIGDALAVFVGRLEVGAPQLYQRHPWEQTPAPELPALEMPGPVLLAEDATGPGPAAPSTSSSVGSLPAADSGPNAPTTVKEGFMPENKSPEVVAREAAEQRASAAEVELARYRAAETARPVVDALLAESDLPEPARARVRAEYGAAVLPLRESDRALDQDVLKGRVSASIDAERAYAAQILESAGVGRVRGAGAAAGAGSGMPAGFAGPGTAASAPGGFFDFMPANPVVQLSEAERAADAANREELIGIYMGRGMTREAAVIAVNAS